jgi:tryptophan-rich sensory protein
MDNTMNWYQQLQKPFFAPPSYVFGIAWSILYPIIFASFGYTIYLVFKKEIPSIVLVPLILNLLFNFLFSPIQFGLQSNILAAIDIVLVIITLVWFIFLVYPYSKMVAVAQVPYLLWGLFATILQFSITWLNR